MKNNLMRMISLPKTVGSLRPKKITEDLLKNCVVTAERCFRRFTLSPPRNNVVKISSYTTRRLRRQSSISISVTKIGGGAFGSIYKVSASNVIIKFIQGGESWKDQLAEASLNIALGKAYTLKECLEFDRSAVWTEQGGACTNVSNEVAKNVLIQLTDA